MSTGLYLFVGPDRSGKLQRIRALRRTLRVDALDEHRVEGAAASASALVGLCRQRPAVSAARLIVIEDAQRLPPACVSGLVHYADAMAQTACVVLLVDAELSVRSPLARAAHDRVMILERFTGTAAAPAKPFAFLDALGTRALPAALEAVREQMGAGKTPLELIGLAAWQIQRWVVVRRLVDAGLSSAQISAVLGMRPWQVERIRSEIAGRPLEALRYLLKRCWDLDVGVKSGRTLPWLAVEELATEVCLSDASATTAVRL